MTKITKAWILKSIQKISKDAFAKTGHSLNGLPEYYVNVMLANELCKKETGKSFELEYQTKDLAAELGVELPSGQNKATKYRLEQGSIDLVVQSPVKYKSQHLIEIKRSSKASSLRADLERLTWFVSKGIKKSLNKAFLVLINPLDGENFKQRTTLEEMYLQEEFNNYSISLTYSSCELSDFNTRCASINKSINNANKSVNAYIWQVKLKQ